MLDIMMAAMPIDMTLEPASPKKSFATRCPSVTRASSYSKTMRARSGLMLATRIQFTNR